MRDFLYAYYFLLGVTAVDFWKPATTLTGGATILLTAFVSVPLAIGIGLGAVTVAWLTCTLYTMLTFRRHRTKR